MDIYQIIDLMILLSPNSDVISSDLEKEAFLNYINLVCAELHSETVSENILAYITESTSPTEWSDNIELLRNAVYVKQVFLPYYKTALNQGRLLQLSYFDSLRIDPDLTDVGAPTHYYFKRNIITLYPKPYSSLILPSIVTYAPDFVALDFNSQEGDIPYPAMYHYVIANGAIYYMALAMGGFKDDRSKLEAERRFQEGKNQLIQYIVNNSGELRHISTYSSI